MIKAVIFDMDGTTVDTVNSIAYFANDALKHFGLSEVPVEKFFTFVGNGPKNLIECLIDYSKGDKKNLNEILEYYLKNYNNNSLYLSKPYDGIVELLEALKNKNIKTAIVSNKQDEAVGLISDTLFGDSIDLSTGTKENVKRKPAPDSLLNTMTELGVEKDEVLFVGDTDVDMITAKNAGVISVGVLWGFRDEDELRSNGADYIVSNPKEILDLVEKIIIQEEI